MKLSCLPYHWLRPCDTFHLKQKKQRRITFPIKKCAKYCEMRTSSWKKVAWLNEKSFRLSDDSPSGFWFKKPWARWLDLFCINDCLSGRTDSVSCHHLEIDFCLKINKRRSQRKKNVIYQYVYMNKNLKSNSQVLMIDNHRTVVRSSNLRVK